MRHHLFQLLLVVTLLLVRPATARQSGPLIADLIDYPDVRAVIPSDTAATFARTTAATPDQRLAATQLVDAARTELARSINRHLRTIRDDPSFDEIKPSEERVLAEAKAVERQLLADLMTILTAEQQSRFPLFERAHRRSLLSRAKPQAMPIDVWKFLEENNYDPANDPVVSALLDKFEAECDTALIRERRAVKAYYDNVRLGYAGTEEGLERNRKAQRELTAAGANLQRVVASIVEPLIDSLPAALSDKFVLEIIRQATIDFDKNLADPARYPIVREVLTLDLAPQQRRDVQSILAAARTQALAEARSTVIEQARHVRLDDEQRTDGRTSPLNLYLQSAAKLRSRVSAEALAVLTPAQRRLYEASEVLEPAPSSVVNDE